MSREALAKSALELRTKALQGVYAVMAAQDLRVRLSTELTALVSHEIDTGALAQRWIAALAEAEAALPGATPAEVGTAALAALLAWQQARACDVAKRYAEQIEAQRTALEARASGIEQALAALAE